MIFEQVCSLIAEQFGVSADSLTEQTNLKEELSADSIDVVELIMALEEKFDVTIEDEDVANIETINDIVEYINART